MRRLIRHRRPRPASIAATVAVFLALGGVAYAVTGSGTFQKTNQLGIGAPAVPSKHIPGVGPVFFGCVGADFEVILGNTSGETLTWHADNGNALVSDTVTHPNSFDPTPGNDIDADEMLHIHVFPADGSKTPQADFTISIDDTGACNTSQVAMLDITTTSSGSGTVEGSGTVQKASLEDIPSTDMVVRTVKGVGRIEAECDSGIPTVSVENSSGEALRAFFDRLSTFDRLPIPAGQGTGFSVSGDTVWRIYLFPADGTKRPQADVTLSVDDTDDCSTSQVSVLSVSTEQ